MSEADSYRYERKFSIAEMDAAQARSILLRHQAMFGEPYPPRYVNNIYLDTYEFDNYGDNLVGAMERLKVRVRWYHDLFGYVDAPVLEFKVKRGLVGWKEQYPFPAFCFERGFSARAFRKTIRESDLPAQVKLRLANVLPSLVNRYHRSYFATKDGRFRSTIDTDLTYYKLNRLDNRFIVRQVDRRNIIVELKYDRANEGHANRIASSLPFRLSRSSKYVQGMENFFL